MSNLPSAADWHLLMDNESGRSQSFYQRYERLEIAVSTVLPTPKIRKNWTVACQRRARAQDFGGCA